MGVGKRIPYHSALKPETDTDEEVMYYERDGSFAFVHDITKGIHPLFYKADVIYTEPAWRSGYDTFLKRAKRENTSSYMQYLKSIKDVILTLKIPTFLLIGKNAKRFFEPEYTQQVRIRGIVSGELAIWNAEPIEDIETNVDVIEILASRYDYLLDFNCGYGLVAKIALEYNKKFICSDINPKCIAILSRLYMRRLE